MGKIANDLRKDGAHTTIEKYNVRAIEPRYAAVNGRRGPERRCITGRVVLVKGHPSLVGLKIDSAISFGLQQPREPSHISTRICTRIIHDGNEDDIPYVTGPIRTAHDERNSTDPSVHLHYC